MKSFNFNKCWPIGLDISTDNIRMLQLQRRHGELCVRDARSWNIPLSYRSNPESFRLQAIEAVNIMFKRSNFRGRKVIVSIPCSKLHIKNLRLPQMPEDRLGANILCEAAERFDFSPAADNLKYFTAGQIRSGNDIYNEIIMVAVEPSVIEEYVQLLDDMKVFVQHIDIEPMAVFRAVERFLRRKEDSNVVSVAIDLGTSSSRIIVARGRQVLFIKGIAIGGKDLDQAVAGQLNLDIAEARELRNRIRQQHAVCLGGIRCVDRKRADSEQRSEVDWTLRDAVRGKIEELAHEISLCLRYCSVTFRGFRPDQIQLSGGEAYDPAMVEILSEQLGINCEVSRPLRGLSLKGSSLDNSGITPHSPWAVSMGLALWQVDMFADRKEKRNEVRLSA